jgi:hypothetical protein
VQRAAAKGSDGSNGTRSKPPLPRASAIARHRTSRRCRAPSTTSRFRPPSSAPWPQRARQANGTRPGRRLQVQIARIPFQMEDSKFPFPFPLISRNRFYGKRSFSVTTPCKPRLAERETLLHRLGSKLNRIVLNSCGNSLSVAQITRDFCGARFFWRTEPFTPKKNPKKEVDYF